jgi:lipopolysaccharide export system permease protein
MRLLDRYLLRELLVPLGYCLGGFLVFWITYDLFTQLANFQENHLTAAEIGEYELIKAPEQLVIVIPLALLLALLYTLGNHARHHEITAMRAAGISLWRLAVPYLGVGLLGGLALLLLNEGAVPESADRAEQILLRHASDQARIPVRQWQRSITFRNELDGRTWRIGAYNVTTHEMRNPSLEWVLPDGTRRKLDAGRALRANDIWVFQDVNEVIIPAGGAEAQTLVPKPRLELPELSETPRLIRSEIKISRLDSLRTAKRTTLSIREIREFLHLHPSLDARRRNLLETMLQNQFAMPWTCLVVVLIALPFGATSGRRNAFVGVASSVLICLLYVVARELALAFGGGGRIEPWVAAWIPNFFFALVGLVLAHRMR